MHHARTKKVRAAMVMDLALWEGSPRVPTGGKISVLPLP